MRPLEDVLKIVRKELDAEEPAKHQRAVNRALQEYAKDIEAERKINERKKHLKK